MLRRQTCRHCPLWTVLITHNIVDRRVACGAAFWRQTADENIAHLQERRWSTSFVWHFLRDSSRPVRIGTARCLGSSTRAQLVFYRQHSAARANHSPGEYPCHCVMHSQTTAPATGADHHRGAPRRGSPRLRAGAQKWIAHLDSSGARPLQTRVSTTKSSSGALPTLVRKHAGRSRWGTRALARSPGEWPRFSDRRRASCTRGGSGPPDASTHLPTIQLQESSVLPCFCPWAGQALSCAQSIDPLGLGSPRALNKQSIH